ncbi:MAG TPA: sortase [Pseudonocardiaceae bacterium]|nr:sortase [Pseudonocardiaceae bacterium]
MSTVDTSAPEVDAAPETASPAPRRPRSPARQVASTALLILSASLLGFALYIGVISQLHYDRAQHDSYADFRVELAQATAPVGPTRPDNPHALLALGTTVAVLTIPEIDVHAVVFEGTTGAVLQDGPGHLRDTVLPGQSGVSEILGRATSYGGPFGRISELNPGDTFTVTTGQGVSDFRVLDTRRAGDTEPPPVAAGKGRLVLATADGNPFLPTGVLRVDADLVSQTQPTPARVLTAAQLPPAELPLAGDPSALFPLVLWGQGLLLAAGLLTWTRGRWGRWQVWIVGVPVLGFFGLAVADQVSQLLFNLI